MRDPICLHARLAVIDGLTHQPIHPLNPATADTAVAARETCALRDAVFPPERRPDMLPASHESLTRGHRVREFVCTYRTLRDDQGQTVRLPTLAPLLGGDSRIAQGQRGEPNGLTLVVAQRAVRADELADAMSAGEAFF